jgi:glutamate-1-semialdehyde 2,1-aminomutase
MLNRSASEKLYEESSKYFPGGVNSPVRAFKSVEGKPVFITKADGYKIWDADGNEFVDFCGSWGPLILGHNHPGIRNAVYEAASNGLSFGAPTIQENLLAGLILRKNKVIEKIRFVSSGTEAVMSATRLARGYTGRNKIIKFEGCYHGHVDHLLVKAGSGLATFGTSSSAGVPEGFAKETIVLPLNDIEAYKKAFEDHKEEIAAVIIEPIPANNGLLLQDKAYLSSLIEIAHENCALAIFDEVISGFRVGFEGAAGYYGLQPDIVTYGKIIGGGMPVGAYGASSKVMSYIAPEGDVYQAGTLSGNPVSMSAGYAALSVLAQDGFYEKMEAKTLKFVNQIQTGIDEAKLPVKVFTAGSIFWIAFTDKEKIQNADDISPESGALFKRMYAYLLEKGVYLGPSGYEVGFVSEAHTAQVLEQSARYIVEALKYAFKLNTAEA